MGWSESKVKNHKALEKVTASAWELIVTNFNAVTPEVTNVTFNETMLRQILKLTAPQQLQLVTDLKSVATSAWEIIVATEKQATEIVAVATFKSREV